MADKKSTKKGVKQKERERGLPVTVVRHLQVVGHDTATTFTLLPETFEMQRTSELVYQTDKSVHEWRDGYWHTTNLPTSESYEEWAPIFQRDIDPNSVPSYQQLMKLVEQKRNEIQVLADQHAAAVTRPFDHTNRINTRNKRMVDVNRLSEVVTQRIFIHLCKGTELLEIPELLTLIDTDNQVEFLLAAEKEFGKLEKANSTSNSIVHYHTSIKALDTGKRLVAKAGDLLELGRNCVIEMLSNEKYGVLHEEATLMLKYGITDCWDARNLIDGGWNDYEQFLAGSSLGFVDAKTWSEAQKLGCDNAEEYNRMTNLGWEDLGVMRLMLQMGFSQDESRLVSDIRGIPYFSEILNNGNLSPEDLNWVRSNGEIIEILNKPGSVPSPRLFVLRQKILASSSPHLRTDRLLAIYHDIPHAIAPGSDILGGDAELENILEQHFSDIIKVDRTAGGVVRI